MSYGWAVRDYDAEAERYEIVPSGVTPPEVKFTRTHQDAQTPTYATDGAACFDLYAATVIHEGRCVVCDTGIAVEIPPGWQIKIHSRSGHGFKSLIRLANCTGIIDSDYRGPVLVKLICDASNSKAIWEIKKGDRVAQGELVPVYRARFVGADSLSETARGAGGFGSTGV